MKDLSAREMEQLDLIWHSTPDSWAQCGIVHGLLEKNAAPVPGKCEIFCGHGYFQVPGKGSNTDRWLVPHAAQWHRYVV